MKAIIPTFAIPTLMPHYSGRIEFNQPRIDNWIGKHRSFASRDWIRSQVTWGIWIPVKDNQFKVEAIVAEGVYPVKVTIILHKHREYVLVYHAHCHGRKR